MAPQSLSDPSGSENLGTSEATPTHHEEMIISPKSEAELPKWSVVHHVDGKQAIDLHSANVITYESPVYCVKISPDGQRLAIGLDEGKTYINDLKTGSNISLASERLVQDFGLL